MSLNFHKRRLLSFWGSLPFLLATATTCLGNTDTGRLKDGQKHTHLFYAPLVLFVGYTLYALLIAHPYNQQTDLTYVPACGCFKKEQGGYKLDPALEGRLKWFKIIKIHLLYNFSKIIWGVVGVVFMIYIKQILKAIKYFFNILFFI